MKPRGSEKGYFCFGGSTIILAFEEGKVSFDKDILAMSKKGIGSKVKFGEQIGLVI